MTIMRWVDFWSLAASIVWTVACLHAVPAWVGWRIKSACSGFWMFEFGYELGEVCSWTLTSCYAECVHASVGEVKEKTWIEWWRRDVLASVLSAGMSGSSTWFMSERIVVGDRKHIEREKQTWGEMDEMSGGMETRG